MKIESIFCLSVLKKNSCILSLIIKINNVKMANMLIKKRLILDYILYKCMNYNLAYKIK